MRRRLDRAPLAVAVALGLCAVAAEARAQALESGALRVVVQDATGGVIPGATVTVTREATPPLVSVTNERGEATFEPLAIGDWSVRIDADGFTSQARPSVQVRRGTAVLAVTLALAAYLEDVTVARDPQEQASDPRGDGLSVTLTPEEMDALPDDPDELAAALEELAGPGAAMSVDGFRGGQLPPKSQIQRIRLRRGVFSAQYHERGGNRVEIVTRPGSDRWRSGLQVVTRDSALNARNAFAEQVTPERQRRVSVSLSGPLVKRLTSFALNVEGVDGFESNTIVTASSAGRALAFVRQPQRRYNVDLSVQHALSASHSARFGYQSRLSEQSNLGVGNFDLASRAYTRDQASHQIRFGEAGVIGRRFYNQLRAQVAWRDNESVAALDAPTIRVQDAFTDGGANVAGGTTSAAFDLEDELEWSWRAHSFVAGTSLMWTRYDSDAIRNALGTFTFASLSDFEAGTPLTFTQRLGDPRVRYGMFQGAWFLQDDLRVRRNLTVSMGVRHEFQQHLSDAWNFSPRAGLVWAPGRSGRTTLRGGAGIFYDWYEASTYEETLQVDGTRVQDLTVRQPGYPNPYGQGLLQVLPSGRVQQGDLHLPIVYQGMAAVERALTSSFRVNLGYTVRNGTGLLRGVNVNAPDANGLRPDPSAGNAIEIRSIGRLREHEVSLGANGRAPWRNVSVGARYTYRRAYDDGNGPTWLAANPLAPDEWGPSAGDVRHRASLMMSLAPLSRVRLSMNLRASSARPYTVTTGLDDNGDTVINDRPAGVERNTLRGDGSLGADVRLSVQLGSTARPDGPPGGGQGGFGGGSGRGRGGGPGGPGGGGGFGPEGGRPDAPAQERRLSTELYLQVFNAFNHVNLTGFSGVLTSPFFGQPTSAQAARRMEIGLRLGY